MRIVSKKDFIYEKDFKILITHPSANHKANILDSLGYFLKLTDFFFH